MSRYPNGRGSYAMKRAAIEAQDAQDKLTNRVKVLEEQVKTLLAGKGGLQAEVAETKLAEEPKEDEKPLEVEDLKLAELKALCVEHGVDTSEFVQTQKKQFVVALKEKGL